MKLVKSTALLAAVFSASSMAALSDSATGTVNANVVDPVTVTAGTPVELGNVEVNSTSSRVMNFTLTGTLAHLSLSQNSSCEEGSINVTLPAAVDASGAVDANFEYTAPASAGADSCSIELIAEYN